MLDDISLELNEGNINFKHSLINNDDNQKKIVRNKEFIDHFNKKEKSIITELFYPNIITTFICKCKKEIPYFAEFKAPAFSRGGSLNSTKFDKIIVFSFIGNLKI